MKSNFLKICVLSSLLVQSGHADSCPLSNPAYKDLKTAATALLVSASSTAGCQDFQDKINSSTAQIQGAVQALTGTTITDGTTTTATPTLVASADTQKNIAVAVSALADLGKITSTYGNTSCGKALTSRVDYVDALSAVVNGLTPYFLLYTPAAPYALGANLLVNSADAFATLYHSTSFNMNDPSQRQVFLDNACAFYNFNNNLLQFIQARQSKQSDIDQQVAALQADLDAFEKVAPPHAQESSDLEAVESILKKDQQAINGLENMLTKLKTADDFVCSLARDQISGINWSHVFPLDLESGYSNLLDDSERAGRDVSFQRSLLRYLKNISVLSHFPSTQSAECGKNAREWITVSEQLLSNVDQELAIPGRRDVSNSPSAQARKDWEDQEAKKKAALAAAKTKQTFLASLTDKGSDVEQSELLDADRQIQDDLFSDEVRKFLGFRRKSPAQAWFEHKGAMLKLGLSDFDSRYPIFTQRYSHLDSSEGGSSTPHDVACAEAGNLLMDWTSAREHSVSAKDFCDALGPAIGNHGYRGVSAFCFGKDSGSNTDPIVVQWIAQVQSREDKAHALKDWMTGQACSIPTVSKLLSQKLAP